MFDVPIPSINVLIEVITESSEMLDHIWPRWGKSPVNQIQNTWFTKKFQAGVRKVLPTN